MGRRSVIAAHALSKESQALYDALQEERDMPCVLLCASFLDQCLASLLGRALTPSSVTAKLLDPQGVLGTYAARTDLCYAMGLVSKEFYQNLLAIGRIRNVFAHSHLALSFADAPVRDWSLGLILPAFMSAPEDGPSHDDVVDFSTDPRERFTIVVTLMVNRLVLTAMETEHRAAKDEWWS